MVCGSKQTLLLLHFHVLSAQLKRCFSGPFCLFTFIYVVFFIYYTSTIKTFIIGLFIYSHTAICLREPLVSFVRTRIQNRFRSESSTQKLKLIQNHTRKLSTCRCRVRSRVALSFVCPFDVGCSFMFTLECNLNLS